MGRAIFVGYDGIGWGDDASEKRGRLMEVELERMSDRIDETLARHGLNGRVCGGYVAGTGILFSLHDGTFVRETAVLDEIQRVLGVRQIKTAPGAIMVQV